MQTYETKTCDETPQVAPVKPGTALMQLHPSAWLVAPVLLNFTQP